MKPLDSIVYIIDDEDDVRSSIANLLESANLDFETFASPQEFLRAKRPIVPGCVLLDLHFPNELHDGLSVQRSLADEHNEIPVIFITGHGDIRMSVNAMKSGATDFLLKPVRRDELLEAVSRAIKRHREHLGQEHALAVARLREASLSPREREIMALVVTGLRNKQIAAGLGLSEITVKVHRSHLMRKMEVRSLAELVRLYDSIASTAQTQDSKPTA
jgi:FixJ family two-component response regulator